VGGGVGLCKLSNFFGDKIKSHVRILDNVMFSGNVFCEIRHILSQNYGMSPHLDIPFMDSWRAHVQRVILKTFYSPLRKVVLGILAPSLSLYYFILIHDLRNLKKNKILVLVRVFVQDFVTQSK
jgi:hypothetical protein